MANTYTQLLYHVVFSTKDRKPAIKTGRRRDLFAYLWGIHENLKCHVYRIGGVDDHIHVLTSIPKTLTLSKYVEQIKTGTTNWVRRESVYPNWPGWQDGYGGFTESWKEKDRLIEYIKNQEEHHRTVTFEEEYLRLLEEAGVDFDERYLF